MPTPEEGPMSVSYLIGDSRMCIMEVRPGQRPATMLQAMAHNTSTIERDLDLLYPILEAHHSMLEPQVREAQANLKAAYQTFLAAFAAQVTTDLQDPDENPPVQEPIGTERQRSELRPSERVTDTDAAMVSEAAALGGRAGFQASAWVAEALANAHKAERYETR